MLTLDLNVAVPRPFTSSGVPPVVIDGVLQTEAGVFLLVEAGQFLAFD
jgi:hypothetical protein